MQLVRSAAGVGDTDTEALFFLAIASARETLDLTSAYFAPRPAFVETLADAAARGVRVQVLVPGKHIDKHLVLAGRAVYDQLTAAGVRIWEYAPTMMHAKTMTVDGVWSTVGSVNFDNRSCPAAFPPQGRRAGRSPPWWPTPGCTPACTIPLT